MKNVRKNVFETNSSSTHSIAISREKYSIPNSIVRFKVGEYGWEYDTVYDTPSYLYTAILENDNYKENLTKLQNILDRNNIQYVMQEIKYSTYENKEYIDIYEMGGYIDHGDELKDFLDEVLNDEDKLLRFLFSSGSRINTGNDNCGTFEDIDISDSNVDVYYKGN